MRTPGNHIRRWSWRLGVVVLIIAVFGGGVLLLDWLGRPPQDQQEAEAHLQREILDYHLWDGTPYVVFRLGDTVYFDRLILDWYSMEWPPTPRWQWTGNWLYTDATTAPASAVPGTTGAFLVVFGQVNDPDITTLEVQVDGVWHRYPVSAPAYAVRLRGIGEAPDHYRMLDAQGRVVWTSDGPYPVE